MDDLFCPYCRTACKPDEESNEPETEYQHECEQCGKNFVYTITYYPFYDSNKAPCLNGGKHNWQKIVGFPAVYYEDMYRCSYCGEETLIKDKK